MLAANQGGLKTSQPHFDLAIPVCMLLLALDNRWNRGVFPPPANRDMVGIIVGLSCVCGFVKIV
jgi:hypothetical protein